MNLKRKKILKKSSFLVGTFSLIGVASITFSSCSFSGPSLSQKLTDSVPDGTPYQNIFASEFSLLFQNKRSDSKRYNTYGTGWLFDYRDSQIDKSLNANTWVGYFGTNLHVADALLNPNDNVPYKPDTTKLGTTENFYLGKYDYFSDSVLRSNSYKPTNQNTVNHPTEHDMTYVKLSRIPKTQFAAIDFYRGANPSDPDDSGLKPYIDFAVLEITLDLSRDSEKLLFDHWIQPAIENINEELLDTTRAMSQNNKSPRNSKDQWMFWREEWNDLYKDSKNQMLAKYRAYIGGYPYVKNNRAPYFYSPNGSTDVNAMKGSPRWTINVNDDTSKESNKLNGQKFDYQNISPSYGFYGSFKYVYGAYLAEDKYYDFTYNYHGEDYRQSGWGYIIHDSNLSGGSSGSILMNQDKQIMGIYFGTFMRNGEETNFGLAQSLVLTESFAKIAKETSKLDIKPYDLIAGHDNMNLSYKTSLGSKKTNLFS